MEAAPAAAGGSASSRWLAHRFFLPAVLIISALLRLALTWQGGQMFFGDENRYQRGIDLYLAAIHGNGAEVQAAFKRPEHIGFTVLGAGLTGLQHATAQLSPWSDWSNPANVAFSVKLGALWLALFSVVNLGLVHRLARAAGADAPQAGWTVLLMAVSNVMFYYSRHLLPYDAAITFFLLAVLVGWGGGRGAFVSGLLAGACYHVYNGYWYLIPVWCFLVWWSDPRAPHVSFVRIVALGAGLGVALAAPVLLGLWLDGAEYWRYMVGFSHTVNQGLYAEGWTFPFEFFWQADRLLVGIILLALLAVAVREGKNGRAAWRQPALWLLALVLGYGLLVLFSNGLERFVVYARTVRPLLCLLCLAGGWALALLLRDRRQALAAGAALLLVAGVNFLPHFAMNFPAETELNILRAVGNPRHTLSVSGSLYFPLAMPVSRPDLALVNAQILYPVRDYIGFPAGVVLLRLPHPLSYLPFQYESHSPRERALLRTHDIDIKLVRLADPAAVPNDLPVQLRFTAADRPTGH